MRLAMVLAASALQLASFAGIARATSVQPVILDLSAAGRKTSTTVEVENNFKTPLPVEMKIEEADFVDGELRANGKPSDDLLVFPPTALIEPGRTQNFRVQYLGDPAIKISRHYVITVAQLPVQLPDTQSAVQVLYNFQVFTSISPLNGKPAIRIANTEIITAADGKPHAVLLLENNADTYGYISAGKVKLRQTDASGKEIYQKTFDDLAVQEEIGYGLVGARQKRRLVTPVTLPSADGTLTAEFIP